MSSPYVDRTEANTLIESILLTEDRQAWVEAENGDKDVSLSQATEDIDSLRIAGSKNDPVQENEFPRGTDTDVPENIKKACVLIAVLRLDGKRPEEEVENLSLTTVGYASVRSTYDRGSVPEYLAAGIVSFEAWRLLKPFLRKPGTFEISKV